MAKSVQNILVLLFLLLSVGLSAQTQRAEDSIKNLLDNAKTDSARVQCYIALGNAAATTDAGAQYAIEGVKFCEEHKDENIVARFKVELMHIAANQFLNGGNYSKALEYYLMESKIVEAKDPNGLGMSSVNMGIGNVYASQENYPKALEYYQKALDIILKQKKSGYLGYCIALYENIGEVNVAMKHYDIALENLRKELDILKTINQPSYEYGNAFTSIGEIYEDKKSYDTALAYFNRALTNFKGIKMPERVASGYVNVARVYVEQGEYDAAIPYYDKALENAIATKSKDVMLAAYQGYADAFEKEGNYQKAYEYHKKYSDMKDSVQGLESQKQMNELETKYESATKDKELLQKDAESKHQKILILFVLAVAIAVGVIAILIFRTLKTTNRQKKLIEEQKALVDEKNKDILASIRYAQRIQHALLASDALLKKNLPEHFVLFKPKDIVSGDFYWAQPLLNPPHQGGLDEKKEISPNGGETEGAGKFIICTGDCTGHGVPGAFMSLLNISLLNEAAIERKLSQPNQILDYVRTRVVNALNPEGRVEESKDGMDCSLSVFDFQNKTMQTACANNPVWIARNSGGTYNIQEVDPDKMPVGIYGGEERPFALHNLSLNKGDIVYSFTDGYADQFGGPKGKKLKYKQLMDILIVNATKPLSEQKAILEKLLKTGKEAWNRWMMY